MREKQHIGDAPRVSCMIYEGGEHRAATTDIKKRKSKKRHAKLSATRHVKKDCGEHLNFDESTAATTTATTIVVAATTTTVDVITTTFLSTGGVTSVTSIIFF